jgi:hypothetical protein
MTAAVVIRRAHDGDRAALARLAALDSSPPPAGEVLLAEVDGEPRAALSLGDGRVVADPFQRTTELVALLELRRDQARAKPQARTWRRRLARPASQPACP